jgi:hypothetical protein
VSRSIIFYKFDPHTIWIPDKEIARICQASSDFYLSIWHCKPHIFKPRKRFVRIIYPQTNMLHAYITGASGVGKKTAERVVVDLSDKVGLPTQYGRKDDPVQTGLNTTDEALEALMALGYTLADATKALENVDPTLPTSKRVTEALKG